jgi:hypothetical protein
VESRARRFRITFWLVVALGSLPSLVSGAVLASHFQIANLCSQERASESLSDLRTKVLWERIHSWGRAGAMIAGLLVVAYATAWAFERKKTRAAVTFLSAALLLPALAITLWTGRVTPWRALEPPVSVGATQVIRAPEAWGGPDYCLKHLDEVRRMRWVVAAHIVCGLLATGLTLALADLGARWRAAKDATPSSTPSSTSGPS